MSEYLTLASSLLDAWSEAEATAYELNLEIQQLEKKARAARQIADAAKRRFDDLNNEEMARRAYGPDNV